MPIGLAIMCSAAIVAVAANLLRQLFFSYNMHLPHRTNVAVRDTIDAICGAAVFLGGMHLIWTNTP